MDHKYLAGILTAGIVGVLALGLHFVGAAVHKSRERAADAAALAEFEAHKLAAPRHGDRPTDPAPVQTEPALVTQNPETARQPESVPQAPEPPKPVASAAPAAVSKEKEPSPRDRRARLIASFAAANEVLPPYVAMSPWWRQQVDQDTMQKLIDRLEQAPPESFWTITRAGKASHLKGFVLSVESAQRLRQQMREDYFLFAVPERFDMPKEAYRFHIAMHLFIRAHDEEGNGTKLADRVAGLKDSGNGQSAGGLIGLMRQSWPAAKADPSANARCPICSYEFNIPVPRTSGDLIQTHACPNCGNEALPKYLLKQKR